MLFYFSTSDRVEWLLVDTWWRACKQLPLLIRNTVTLGPSSLMKFRFKISNFRSAIRNFASVQTKLLRNFALGSANFREVLKFLRSSPKVRRNFTKKFSAIFRLNNSRNSAKFVCILFAQYYTYIYQFILILFMFVIIIKLHSLPWLALLYAGCVFL